MMFPPTLAQQQATIPDTWTIFKIDQDAPIVPRQHQWHRFDVVI